MIPVLKMRKLGHRAIRNCKGGSSSAAVLKFKLMRAGSSSHALLPQTPALGTSVATAPTTGNDLNKYLSTERWFSQQVSLWTWGNWKTRLHGWSQVKRTTGKLIMAQSVTSPVACSFDHVFWGKSYTLMEGQKEKTFDPTPGPGEGHTSLTPWPHPPCPKGVFTLRQLFLLPHSHFQGFLVLHMCKRTSWTRGQANETEAQLDASQATAWGKFAPTSNTYLSSWRFSKPNSVLGVLWNFLSGIIL